MKLKNFKGTIQELLEEYWDKAIKSMHRTSPEDKSLVTTSGKVEEQLEILYNKHRVNLKELFGSMEITVPTGGNK